MYCRLKFFIWAWASRYGAAPWGTHTLPEQQLKAQESIDLILLHVSPECMLGDVRVFQRALADYVYATESHPWGQESPFGTRKCDSVCGFYSIYRSLISLLQEHLHAAHINSVPQMLVTDYVKKVRFQLKENKIAPMHISGGIPCQWVGSSYLGFDKHFEVVMTSYDIPLQSSAN